jgi:hypothetical protein
MKVRISKKLLSQYPIEVQNYIDYWKQYVKSATIVHENAPYTLYNGEGYKFFIWYNGTSMTVNTVSSDTLGASGMNHDICGSTLIPANTIIIEVSYYAGYMMRIIHVDAPALPA